MSPGNEVDHAADVLRPVAHRAAAAHHVHRLQITDRQRGHRQLRLAVRRDRQRDAVHQNGGARRKTRSQAAHADVERDVAAAGAVAVAHLHAGYAAQAVGDGLVTLFVHLLLGDDGTRARMVEQHRTGIRVVQPVADDGHGIGIVLR